MKRCQQEQVCKKQDLVSLGCVFLNSEDFFVLCCGVTISVKMELCQCGTDAFVSPGEQQLADCHSELCPQDTNCVRPITAVKHPLHENSPNI